ncbi:MAG: nitrate reductase cytochrome c-type subunit [Sulfuricella sp.]|nr:nitrate reductase cytochrome c-type subunit [Sulfuricella sp.]
MKTRNTFIGSLFAAALAALLVASCASTPAEKPQGLRLSAITDQDAAPAILDYAGKTPGEQERIARNYEQQPPLIPHKVEGMKLDFKTNKCLQCHDRPFYKEEGAPKIGDSHYKSREGKELDKISMARYNCNQCHVPQVNAPPLVANVFKSAKE